jgi:DNA adenine methylase
VKIVCPRCGRPGYVTRVKIRNRYYVRVEHVESGKKRVCHLGRDVDELRRALGQLLGFDVATAKLLNMAGGDYYIADLLMPRLERLCAHRCTLVEVFGGSGYVSQTASREKFSNVVYNDVNSLLTAFYRHVKERPEQLATILLLLPYSRSYYGIVMDLLKTCRDFGSLVVAALAFYAYNASFASKAGKGFAYNADPGKNRAREFKSKACAVLKYAEAWRDVVIENLDFRDAIKKYDSERTVFYLDPPYVGKAEDYYGTRFTVEDLRDMATMLTQIRGRFLLKLDYETYKLISDILTEDRYVVEVFERMRHMKKVKGGRRDTWLLTLVSSK